MHLCWGYMAFICQSKSCWFIGKSFPRKPQTSNLGLVIRMREELELFFLRECLSGILFWNGMLWHSFKKNCIHRGLGKWKIAPTELAECVGSSETSVLFFYLLIGVFLIAFLEKLMPEIVFSLQCSVFSKWCLILIRHRLFGKAITAVVVANKKWYSCGEIWFLRMPNCSCEKESFYLPELLFGFVMASSKNNANIVPISGGSVGCGGYFT